MKAPKPPKPPRTRRRTWSQFGLASLGLAYVLGIALATLLVGGLVLHALVPNRSFDVFAALHNDIVLGVLLALASLWLLPPYPWAARPAQTEARQPAPAAGGAIGGGGIVVGPSQYPTGSRLAGHPLGGVPME